MLFLTQLLNLWYLLYLPQLFDPEIDRLHAHALRRSEARRVWMTRKDLLAFSFMTRVTMKLHSEVDKLTNPT